MIKIQFRIFFQEESENYAFLSSIVFKLSKEKHTVLLVQFPVKLLTAWTTVSALLELKLPVKMNTGVVSTFDHKLFLINYISSLQHRSKFQDILIDTVNHLSIQVFLQRRVHRPIVVNNWPVNVGILSKLQRMQIHGLKSHDTDSSYDLIFSIVPEVISFLQS